MNPLKTLLTCRPASALTSIVLGIAVFATCAFAREEEKYVRETDPLVLKKIEGTRSLQPYKAGKVAFTKDKEGNRFAIYLPSEDERQIPSVISLKGLPVPPTARITLLGGNAPLTFQPSGDECLVSIPPALASNPYCEHAWVLKIAAP